MSHDDTALSGLIVTVPADKDTSLFWWRVADDKIVARGNDYTPPEAIDGDGPSRVMALLPAADTMLRTFSRPDMSIAQAETTARIEAQSQSIGPHVFTATRGTERAVLNDDGVKISETVCVQTASISRDRMAARLAELTLRGLDPDIMLPVGCLLPLPATDDANEGDQAIAASFGDLAVVGRGDLVLPQGDPLQDHLIADTEIATLDQSGRDASLVAAFSAPRVNLRQGEFAKQRPAFRLNEEHKRTLMLLVASVLLLSLAIPLIEIAKLHWNANRIEENTLADARTILPDVQTLDQAEQQLDTRLAARGIGNSIASAPIAVLLSNMQTVNGLTLREMRYQPGGLLSAIVAAPQVDPINQMLLTLQQNGYVVTASPRTDTTGSAIADITLRAP